MQLPADIPHMRLDIRYATPNNFTKKVLYPAALAYLRREVYDNLRNACVELADKGYGVIIYDAYRPYSVTVEMWNSTAEKAYVANPRTGSRHNRGAAVDIGLYFLNSGQSVDMGTDYDDFTPAASPTYGNLETDMLQRRLMLFNIMRRNGFQPHPEEWWHFDFNDYNKFPIMDIPFAGINCD